MKNNNFENMFYEKLLAATRKAFLSLFENKEHFYYCTLVTTGDGLTPTISAWSYEALERECAGDDSLREDIEWSYADSPYDAFGYELFDEVKKLLSENEISYEQWDEETEVRLNIMEKVMRTLDDEGIFSKNQNREEVVVAAEIMPPDETNTERAYRLNNKDSVIFQRWLEEAAEE